MMKKRIKLECRIQITADTMEDALQKMHDELLNTDAKVTDGNGEPSQSQIDQYGFWDAENEGDVQYAIHKTDSTLVEVENILVKV